MAVTEDQNKSRQSFIIMMITERQILPMKHHLDSLSFAECVYTMLEDAATQGFEDIIRWEADGRSFKVYNVKEFEKHVQPVYLNQSKLRSFQRKLVAHGFTCIQGGPSRGAYRHDMFVRGCKDTCRYIQQLKTASPPTTKNILGTTDPSSLSLEDDMGLVGGDSSLMVCDSAPPLSAHFWKAVLESQPTNTSPTGGTSTRKSLLTVTVDDDHYQQRHPSSTFKALAPLVGDVSNKQKKPSPPAAMDHSSAAVVDAAMMSLLTTSSEAPPHQDSDDQAFVLPLPTAGLPPPTMTVAPTTMLMRSYCAQPTSIATSCFLSDPDESLLFPSSSVARHQSSNNNQTSKDSVTNGTNAFSTPKKKGITDSMSFSLFSMELDDILLDDAPRPHTNNNHQISSRDTLSLQESILCGSWRERLLTTDEDDAEDTSFQDYIPFAKQRGACSSSSSSDQGSIWSSNILSS